MYPLFDNFHPLYHRQSTITGGLESLFLHDETAPAGSLGAQVDFHPAGAIITTEVPQPVLGLDWSLVSTLDYPQLHLALLTMLPIEECTYLINNCQRL